MSSSAFGVTSITDSGANKQANACALLQSMFRITVTVCLQHIKRTVYLHHTKRNVCLQHIQGMMCSLRGSELTFTLF